MSEFSLAVLLHVSTCNALTLLAGIPKPLPTKVDLELHLHGHSEVHFLGFAEDHAHARLLTDISYDRTGVQSRRSNKSQGA